MLKMFRKGIHRARVKYKEYKPWIDCMVEYVDDCRIYLYTDVLTFNGTRSNNFIKNSYGYTFCFHTSASWFEAVVYLDYVYIGEL